MVPQRLALDESQCGSFFDHTDLFKRHGQSTQFLFGLERPQDTREIDALADHVAVFERLRC
jgi:hypothetical protein